MNLDLNYNNRGNISIKATEARDLTGAHAYSVNKADFTWLFQFAML